MFLSGLMLVLLFSSARAEDAVVSDCHQPEILENLQNARRELYSLGQGVVSVQVINPDLSAWMLASLQSCALETQARSLWSGRINQAELALWQEWCRSFLGHFEAEFKTHPIHLPADIQEWQTLLDRAYTQWLEQYQDIPEEQQAAFELFQTHATEHLQKFRQSLESSFHPGQNAIIKRQGTGFLIKPGVVVTTLDVARHEPTDQIRVWSDVLGGFSTGQWLGGDMESNLAIIRLASPGESLPPTLTLTPEVDTQPGDLLFAFRHAFNQPVSIFSGELNGKHRHIPFYHHATFLETSFPTSPGTLGAPIVNLKGEVVGITSLFMVQGNMSEVTYALPADQILFAVEQILSGTGNSDVQRGRMGVFVRDHYDTQSGQKQVMVNEVEADSPAAQHGLRKGDLILAIDGVPIFSRSELISKLCLLPPNKTVELEIFRQQDTHKITLQLAPQVP